MCSICLVNGHMSLDKDDIKQKGNVRTNKAVLFILTVIMYVITYSLQSFFTLTTFFKILFCFYHYTQMLHTLSLSLAGGVCTSSQFVLIFKL